MDDLFRIYSKTVFESANAISEIQNELQTTIPQDEIFEIMKNSSENIISLWQNGRKSNRTSIARRTIPDYPNELLKISILLDAIVNLFDDLIDEQMKKQQQQIALLELIRVISLFAHNSLPTKISERIALFFNKGIVIAASEQTFLRQLAQVSNPEEQFNLGIKIYQCRSIDIDIFFEMPLLWKNENLTAHPILALARNVRALALMKKDWHDLNHDNIHGSHTPVSIMFALTNENEAHNYAQKLAAHYFNKLKNMKSPDNSLTNQIMINLLEYSEKNFQL